MSRSEEAARLCLNVLVDGPRIDQTSALAIYNYAVARLLETALSLQQNPWEHTIRLPNPAGTTWLKVVADAGEVYSPTTDRLQAADRLAIGGSHFTERVQVRGMGAPLVSIGPGRTQRWSLDLHYYGVTAIVTFAGPQATLKIIDPTHTTSVSVGSHTYPVSSDLSAPLALGIAETHPESFGLRSLLRTDRYLDAAKMLMVEPYREHRTPVILIHGLASSPATWTAMVNGLNADPVIRQHYQVWVFRYPTGLPFPYSAFLFRQELAEIYREHPETPKAILVGHSMGGLIADLLVRNSGQRLCQNIFGKSFEELQLDEDERVSIYNTLVFPASPYISKVIFVATPHRGASLASNPFGRLFTLLVRLPRHLVMLGPKILSQMNASPGEKLIDRCPTSIDTLRPESRIILALQQLPIVPSIRYYSIIGDDGEGNSPLSSDGVVRYQSSHLEGAQSECIVPSGHSAIVRDPRTIAEVRRILLLSDVDPTR